MIALYVLIGLVALLYLLGMLRWAHRLSPEVWFTLRSVFKRSSTHNAVSKVSVSLAAVLLALAAVLLWPVLHLLNWAFKDPKHSL